MREDLTATSQKHATPILARQSVEIRKFFVATGCYRGRNARACQLGDFAIRSFAHDDAATTGSDLSGLDVEPLCIRHSPCFCVRRHLVCVFVPRKSFDETEKNHCVCDGIGSVGRHSVDIRNPNYLAYLTKFTVGLNQRAMDQTKAGPRNLRSQQRLRVNSYWESMLCRLLSWRGRNRSK